MTMPNFLIIGTAILATHSDGVLIVIDAQKTRKGSVRQSVRNLQAVEVEVLDTIMINAEISHSD